MNMVPNVLTSFTVIPLVAGQATLTLVFGAWATSVIIAAPSSAAGKVTVAIPLGANDATAQAYAVAISLHSRRSERENTHLHESLQ